MPDYLVDTNILIYWIQPTSPHRASVRTALRTLTDRGDGLCITPQNLVEFYTVATRSIARGGLALSPAEAMRRLQRLEKVFRLLPDSPSVLPAWSSLVTTHTITDMDAHDARLVAFMQVYGLSHILTVNVRDFAAFPALTVVDPAHV